MKQQLFTSSPPTPLLPLVSLRRAKEQRDVVTDTNKHTAVTEIIRSKGSFWSADELSEVLCISRKHIYKLAKAGRIPHYRISGSVRFDPEAIAQWLEKRSIN